MTVLRWMLKVPIIVYNTFKSFYKPYRTVEYLRCALKQTVFRNVRLSMSQIDFHSKAKFIVTFTISCLESLPILLVETPDTLSLADSPSLKTSFLVVWRYGRKISYLHCVYVFTLQRK